MPSDSDDSAADRVAAASRFIAALGAMMTIAVGVQTVLLLWRAAIQLTDPPERRALHD
ncbi:hypothetical protein AB4Z42_16670 [Mycobacterium sp. 2YAF39]|uniref:hypothetical protein n=1 Tax=Mycobacterium sp. 2YAF39 TaxID=3233033 RepID=UPI003F9E722C